MKIYFLRSSPITTLDTERFGYYTLKRKFDVKFLDVSKIFNPNFKSYINLKEFLNKDNIKFNNISELKQFLKDTPDYIIDYLKFGFHENKFRLLLKSYGIKLVRNIHHAPKPNLISPYENKSFLKKIILKLINIIKKLIVKFFFTKFDFYLIPGVSVLKQYNINNNSNKILKTASLDYDKSINIISNSKKLKQNKFNFFIDQDFPNHIDHKIKKTTANI